MSNVLINCPRCGEYVTKGKVEGIRHLRCLECCDFNVWINEKDVLIRRITEITLPDTVSRAKATRLPRKFTLGGMSYVVLEVDNDNTCLGSCDSALCEIEIQTKIRGKSRSLESKEQTLFHEVVHCIFNETGRRDLSNNEALVQSFAVLLHQFINTREFSNEI